MRQQRAAYTPQLPPVIVTIADIIVPYNAKYVAEIDVVPFRVP